MLTAYVSPPACVTSTPYWPTGGVVGDGGVEDGVPIGEALDEGWAVPDEMLGEWLATVLDAPHAVTKTMATT
jgi:hypothetical protein